MVSDVRADVGVLLRKRHAQQQRVTRLVPNRAIAVHVRDQQREDDEVCLIRAALLAMLLSRAEKQIQEVNILHEHDAQLIEENHQTLSDVVRKDLVLARSQQL